MTFPRLKSLLVALLAAFSLLVVDDGDFSILAQSAAAPPLGYVLGQNGLIYRQSDGSGPYTFDGNNMVLATPAIIASRPTPKTMAILGDSFMGNRGYGQGNLPCTSVAPCLITSSGNYMGWAQAYSNYALNMPALSLQGSVTNCGVGGTVSAQILANVGCILLAGPDVVVINSGTNDAATSVPCATTVANHRAMYQTFASAGIIVIKVSIIPRPAFTTAQANLAQCVNAADRRYAEAQGLNRFYFLDLDPLVVDPTVATWSIKSGYLRDGIHPSQIGGSVIGLALAKLLNPIAPSWRTPLVNNGDVYDAVNNPGGKANRTIPDSRPSPVNA